MWIDRKSSLWYSILYLFSTENYFPHFPLIKLKVAHKTVTLVVIDDRYTRSYFPQLWEHRKIVFNGKVEDIRFAMNRSWTKRTNQWFTQIRYTVFNNMYEGYKRFHVISFYVNRVWPTQINGFNSFWLTLVGYYF